MWSASRQRTRDPLAEDEVDGDHRRAMLLAIADQIEQQLTAGAIEGHKAEFVDDQVESQFVLYYTFAY